MGGMNSPSLPIPSPLTNYTTVPLPHAVGLHCTRPVHRALSYLSYFILSLCIFCKTLLYIGTLGGQHCWTFISLSGSLPLLFSSIMFICLLIFIYMANKTSIYLSIWEIFQVVELSSSLIVDVGIGG